MSSDSRVELIYCEYEMQFGWSVSWIRWGCEINWFLCLCCFDFISLWVCVCLCVKGFGLIFVRKKKKITKRKTWTADDLLCWELIQATSEFRRVQMSVLLIRTFLFLKILYYVWLHNPCSFSICHFPICHHQFTWFACRVCILFFFSSFHNNYLPI